MNRNKFLENLIDVIQTEENINFDTVLEDLEEWDSLSMMATIAFLDREFSVKISLQELKEFNTVEDIAKKAGL